MRPVTELRQLATEERRLARRPQIIECLDALLELTTKRQRPKTDRKAYMRAYMAKYRKRGPK
jgi:hypothetical protein